MNFTGAVAVGTTIDTIVASAALAASSTSTTSHFHELEPHIGISFECCQLHSGKVVQFVWPLESLDEPLRNIAQWALDSQKNFDTYA